MEFLTENTKKLRLYDFLDVIIFHWQHHCVTVRNTSNFKKVNHGIKTGKRSTCRARRSIIEAEDKTRWCFVVDMFGVRHWKANDVKHDGLERMCVMLILLEKKLVGDTPKIPNTVYISNKPAHWGSSWVKFTRTSLNFTKQNCQLLSTFGFWVWWKGDATRSGLCSLVRFWLKKNAGVFSVSFVRVWSLNLCPLGSTKMVLSVI